MIYGAIDVGGTKTLVAVFDEHGTVLQQQKFPTPPEYKDFLVELQKTIQGLEHHDFHAVAIAMPGSVDRDHGLVHAFGNLAWRDIPVIADVEKIVHCPVTVDNDANLAGLSEALLVPQFEKALYLTISTGIGSGIIVNGKIDPEFADSEAGDIMIEHDGDLRKWESFASGKAIVAKYGKRASDLDDPGAWKVIAHDFAIGILDLIAVIQPDVIVIGGGVGAHFEKYGEFLLSELKKYENPMLPIPPVLQAQRAEEAVIYGCFALARQMYGHDNT
jgi:glucokinase